MTPREPPPDPEATWLSDVYRGDQVPQLTLRALVMGGLIGAVMCLSNLYLGLMAGFAIGVAVSACLLSYSLHGSLVRIAPGLFGPRMSILENNAMQTTASAAGYAVGGTIPTVAVAYLLLNQQHIPGWTLVAWTFCTSALGAFSAIPFKRQLINREQLAFPTGTATALTLRTLHEGQAGTGSGARVMAAAGLIGILPGRVPGLEGFSAFLGAGALIGPRVAASMLLGAAASYALGAPASQAFTGLRAEDLPGALPWFGMALMVSSSLAYLGLQGKAFLRALGGLLRWATTRTRAAPADPLAALEIPGSWFWPGFLALSAATVFLSQRFDVPPIYGVLAIGLSFLMCLVTCRVQGETDGVPPVGQITQLACGALLPRSMVANLMAFSLTGNSSGVAGDLLSDLKSGHLLGANPRKQFLAQLAGCALGALVVVPLFFLLVPDASAVGGKDAPFPAPAAVILMNMSRTLTGGLGSLAPVVLQGMLIVAGVGLGLSLLEALLPSRAAAFVPSPLGLGIACFMPILPALLMFLGSAVAFALRRVRPQSAAAQAVIPAASGLIAGESVGALGAVLIGALSAPSPR